MPERHVRRRDRGEGRGAGKHRWRIRRARRGDIPGLLALESLFPTDRLSRASFRHLLARGHADVLVFEKDKRVIGDVVILYRRGTHTARLYSLITNPAHRGQGIGTQLIAAAERAAHNCGCRRVHLEVRPTNRAAIRLYRKHGYEIERRIAGFYEDGTDAQRLGKLLTSQRSGSKRKNRAQGRILPARNR